SHRVDRWDVRPPSIPPLSEQTPRDHLRLDLGGALEDVQDARIAENPADRILERETVAAVDLHRIVGSSPGDARAEQLGHAGLEVAAPALVLLARGKIGELARDRDLRGHHGELVAHTREIEDALARLLAVERIAQAHVQCRKRDTDGARRG